MTVKDAIWHVTLPESKEAARLTGLEMAKIRPRINRKSKQRVKVGCMCGT
jgi:hypothetical protein